MVHRVWKNNALKSPCTIIYICLINKAIGLCLNTFLSKYFFQTQNKLMPCKKNNKDTRFGYFDTFNGKGGQTCLLCRSWEDLTGPLLMAKCSGSFMWIMKWCIRFWVLYSILWFWLVLRAKTGFLNHNCKRHYSFLYISVNYFVATASL